MKKQLSFVLFLLLLLSLSSPALATTTTVDLESIATATIQITEAPDEYGNIITTFDNLDGFINSAKSTYPMLSDYEIAVFLMEYTYQNYNNLPEEEILHFLTYDNVTTTSSYIAVNDEGNFFLPDASHVLSSPWPTPDGYMEITTSYSYRKTVGQEKYYEVWARAVWLRYPAIALEDAFVLGTSGTFDDSYNEFGSVVQVFECLSGCTRNTTRSRSVSNTTPEDFDLTMTYGSSYVPELHFFPISPCCDYCPGQSRDSSFVTYIRYGMIADESVNIQAGYAHKTFGVGNISVVIDVAGAPSFSAGLSTVTEYIARPVTVYY